MKTNMDHKTSQEDGPKHRTQNFGPEFWTGNFEKFDSKFS